MNNYGAYASFDFCATLSCPAGMSQTNKVCKYAQDSSLPFLVLVRYMIRSTKDGTTYSCQETAGGWPSDATGEVNYLLLWSNGKGSERHHFSDAGIFHSNQSR